MKNPFIPTTLIVVTAIFFLAFNQVNAQTPKGTDADTYRIPDPSPLLVDSVPPKKNTTYDDPSPIIIVPEQNQDTVNVGLRFWKNLISSSGVIVKDTSDTKWFREITRFSSADGLKMQFKFFNSGKWEKPVQVFKIAYFEAKVKLRPDQREFTKIFFLNNIACSFHPMTGYKQASLIINNQQEILVFIPDKVNALKIQIII